MTEDFFSDRGRDPREYPEDAALGTPAAPPPQDRGHHRPPHVGAILLIVAGVLVFLSNTGLVHIGNIFEYWPVILIAVGVSKLTCSRGLSRVWALIVTGIGALFLAHSMGFFGFNFSMMWPIALIGAGFLLLLRRDDAAAMMGKWPAKMPGVHQTPYDEREVHMFSFFGGAKRVTDTDDFRGGDAVAIFGGVDIDLRLAKMSGAAKEVIIDANALFGGINIKVPDNWRVAVRGIGIFGGYDDKTLRRRSDVSLDGPLLVITGYAVFGGIEVKS